MSEVTVAGLDKITEMLMLKEREKDDIEEKLKTLNKEISTLEAKCTGFLKDLGRDEYTSKFGKVKIEQKWSVNLPDSDLNKLEFFAWLQERNIFNKYATVNSRSLQSIFKAEWDEAKKRGDGMMFTLPGINAPKLFEKTDFKVAKEYKKKGENHEPRATSQNTESNDEIPNWD